MSDNRAAQLLRRPGLDGVRGFGILIVIAYHIGPNWLQGNTAVMDIFFCLSGYLITGILWRELTTTGRISLKKFYWRRAIRLFPALALALLVIFPLVAIALGEAAHIISSSMMVLGYVYDLTAARLHFAPQVTDTYWHTWSLAVEEQFYILWPFALLLLHRFVRPSRQLVVLGIALLVSYGAWLMSAATLGLSATYFLPFGHVPSLILGSGLAIAELKGRVQPVATRTTQVLGNLSLAAIIVISFVHIELNTPLPAFAMYALWSVFGLLLVRLASIPGLSDPVSRLLACPPILWLSSRSYALYLYHSSLCHLPPHFGWPSVPGQLGMLAFAMLLADLSYRFVEAPVRAWGRQYLQRRQSVRRFMAPAPAVA